MDLGPSFIYLPVFVLKDHATYQIFSPKNHHCFYHYFIITCLWGVRSQCKVVLMLHVLRLQLDHFGQTCSYIEYCLPSVSKWTRFATIIFLIKSTKVPNITIIVKSTIECPLLIIFYSKTEKKSHNFNHNIKSQLNEICITFLIFV